MAPSISVSWYRNQPIFLRDLTTQTIKPTIAANRITGSASMKMGIVPDVSVTIVDRSRTRQIPDASITKPFWSLFVIRPIA